GHRENGIPNPSTLLAPMTTTGGSYFPSSGRSAFCCSIIPLSSGNLYIPLFGECNPMQGFVGPRWPELDKIGTCRVNDPSVESIASARPGQMSPEELVGGRGGYRL
ncbi:hypothetical protein JOQ06_004806, partial [Pogonophryne albipinna]